MHNYLTYISKFEVYLFSIKYQNFRCAKGVSICCIILLFSDTHATLKIYYVFLFFFCCNVFRNIFKEIYRALSISVFRHHRLFFNRPTLSIKMPIYEHMFTSKCCQKDVETLLYVNNNYLLHTND